MWNSDSPRWRRPLDTGNEVRCRAAEQVGRIVASTGRRANLSRAGGSRIGASALWITTHVLEVICQVAGLPLRSCIPDGNERGVAQMEVVVSLQARRDRHKLIRSISHRLRRLEASIWRENYPLSIMIHFIDPERRVTSTLLLAPGKQVWTNLVENHGIRVDSQQRIEPQMAAHHLCGCSTY